MFQEPTQKNIYDHIGSGTIRVELAAWHAKPGKICSPFISRLYKLILAANVAKKEKKKSHPLAPFWQQLIIYPSEI